MITYIILLVLLSVPRVLLSPLLLFSDVSLSSSFLNSIYSAQTWYSSMNAILPVDSIVTCLGIVLAIEAVVVIYKLIRWVYRKIPGIS